MKVALYARVSNAPGETDRLADELADLLAEALIADLQSDPKAGASADEEQAG